MGNLKVEIKNDIIGCFLFVPNMGEQSSKSIVLVGIAVFQIVYPK